MFVQIVEGRTKDREAVRRKGEAWEQEVGPSDGFLGATAGVTADGRSIAIVRFESEEAARANSDRPEQTKWAAEMGELYDGEPSYTESSDVTLWMGGGSNDAGFVQVMKSTGVDRAAIEKMDAVFEQYTSLRPDLLGGIRVWT